MVACNNVAVASAGVLFDNLEHSPIALNATNETNRSVRSTHRPTGTQCALRSRCSGSFVHVPEIGMHVFPPCKSDTSITSRYNRWEYETTRF